MRRLKERAGTPEGTGSEAWSVGPELGCPPSTTPPQDGPLVRRRRRRRRRYPRTSHLPSHTPERARVTNGAAGVAVDESRRHPGEGVSSRPPYLLSTCGSFVVGRASDGCLFWAIGCRAAAEAEVAEGGSGERSGCGSGETEDGGRRWRSGELDHLPSSRLTQSLLPSGPSRPSPCHLTLTLSSTVQRDRPQVPPRPQAPVQNRSTNVPPPRPPPAAPDADTAARSFFPSPPQTKTRPSRRQESAENDAATSSHSVHTPDQGPAQPRQTHRAPRTPALPPAAGSAYLFLGGQPHPTQSVKHRYGKSQRLAPVRARRGPSFSDEEDNARVDHRPNRGRATDRTEPVQEGTERRPRDGVSTTKKRGRDKEARLDLEADGRGAARPQKKLRLDDGKTVSVRIRLALSLPPHIC